ncbi:MAG: M20/M25/M40 family metallo-hydrolase [Mariniblastus sp.]
MKYIFCFLVAITLAGSPINHILMAQDASTATKSDEKGDEKIDSMVKGYKGIAGQIIVAARKQNDSYLKLQELCDDIGHRLSGSESLDKAIQWAQTSMKKDGHENVRAEKVMIRKWVRGNESCELVLPRPMKIDMLGLGGSIGTPEEGITAEVIVVDDKEELDGLSDEQVSGKIVVFNAAMPMFSEASGSGYGETVQYRSNGAKWAAERGGVAALVRSVTAYSLASPHTGAMRYDSTVKKVPTAAISVEAAMMLRRLQNRGKECSVKLSMQAKDMGEAPSANVIAEIVGSEKPEEIVLIGGHIDSWDVGQGAQDDGAGCVAAMEALNIIRKLGLKPKRTIRVVLWTNEENGLAGAKSYLARHQEEIHVAGIESDSGGFKPQGLSIDMEDDLKEEVAVRQLSKILSLLDPAGATRAKSSYSGADVGQLKRLGTACMGLNVDGRLYFNTHHTWADTVDKVNPKELTDCAITLAVTAFVFADMPGRLGDDVTKGE